MIRPPQARNQPHRRAGLDPPKRPFGPGGGAPSAHWDIDHHRSTAAIRPPRHGNDLIETPAERDLPPARAARMRADLLSAIAAPRPRPARRRLPVAAAAAVTLVAGAAVTLGVRQEDRTQIVALGPGELDGGLRDAVRQCVTWTHAASPGDKAPDPARGCPARSSA